MAGRRLPKEIQKKFDKYMKGNVRRLHREDAVTMFQEEFDMSQEQAKHIFDCFDKDGNGVMSIMEFQQFYQCVGNNAVEMMKTFEDLDKDGSGKLDVEEARAGLEKMTVAGGRSLAEGEIEFFLKNSMDENKLIDLSQFATLLYRLKLYKGPAK